MATALSLLSLAALLLLLAPPLHARLLQDGSSERLIKMIMSEYGRTPSKTPPSPTPDSDKHQTSRPTSCDGESFCGTNYHRKSVTPPPPPKSAPPKDQTTITLPCDEVITSPCNSLRQTTHGVTPKLRSPIPAPTHHQITPEIRSPIPRNEELSFEVSSS